MNLEDPNLAWELMVSNLDLGKHGAAFLDILGKDL